MRAISSSGVRCSSSTLAPRLRFAAGHATNGQILVFELNGGLIHCPASIADSAGVCDGDHGGSVLDLHGELVTDVVATCESLDQFRGMLVYRLVMVQAMTSPCAGVMRAFVNLVMPPTLVPPVAVLVQVTRIRSLG